MKKNKFVIYVVMFFAFFLIGSIKVKAADYTICHYVMSHKEIADLTDQGIYKKDETRNQHVYLYYRNHKWVTGALNTADGDNTLSRFNLSILKDLNSLKAATSCPDKVVLNGYTTRQLYSIKSHEFKKDQTLTIGLDSKNEYSYLDTTCQYISEDKSKTEDIVFQWHAENYFNSQANDFFEYDVNILHEGEKKAEFILDDEKNKKEHSDATSMNDFFSGSVKGCPKYMYKKYNKSDDYMFGNYGALEDASYEKFTNNPSATVETGLGDLIGGDDFTPIDYGNLDDVNCEGIFGDIKDEKSLMHIIDQIFTWIRIAVPILLIILGVTDFTKVVASQDPDAMKKSTSKFVKRCIMAAIIFFLPSLIMLILQWINDYIISTTPGCVIGNLSIIIGRVFRY